MALTKREKAWIDRTAARLLRQTPDISDSDLRFELVKACSDCNVEHDEDWIKRAIDKAKHPEEYKRPPQGYGFS